MFCKKCGKELADGTKFCDGCGQAVEETVKEEQIFNAPVQKSKSKGKKIGGIIMAVLGGLSVLGSFANDYYWNIAHNGMNMSDFITIGIQIALIAGGVYLIYKSKK